MKGTDTPLVTVLMPAYNVEGYISEAVESVLGQSFEDFELLIINDGSTDGTAEVIATYTDSRIRMISQENRGVTGALNAGLALASGKYIARFDADDVCYSHRLEKQVAFLEQHPEFILLGSEADYMDEQGADLFTFHFENYTHEAIIASGFRTCPFIHSSVMYRKDVVQAAGGYDPKALTFEDHMLWRNLADAGKMCNFQEPLIRVRFNPDSVTIDEKWRGETFIRLKRNSIARGYLTEEEFLQLRDILRQQNFNAYKQAAYYNMIGKKFLWNKHIPAQARDNFRKAIRIMPGKAEPYLLYLFSFLPEQFIRWLYKRLRSS